MQVITLEKNRGYLIAGIGAIIALFAFAFLPHVTISSTTSGQTFSYAVASVSQFQISVWIEGLMAAATIAIAALIAFKPNPFDFLKSPALLDTQIRYANSILIGAGILGILTQLIITFSLSSQVQQGTALYITSNTFLVGADTSVSFAAGSWLYLLGMLAVIGGGFLAARTMQRNAYLPLQTGTYVPPVGQQPWMSSPYEAQGSQQQWNTGQSVPPPYQQWNTGPHMQQMPQTQPQQPAQPTQMMPPNTGQPLPPTQMQPGNTGQQWNSGRLPPSPMQQQPWNTGQQIPPQPWNSGQQPPQGPPYH